MNKITLTGRTTKAPDFRQTPTTTIVTLSIAFRDGKNVDNTPKTSFIECTAFGKTADFIVKYCRKGSLVAIDGNLTIDSWEKDGKKQTKARILISTFELMESTKEEEEQKEDPLKGKKSYTAEEVYEANKQLDEEDEFEEKLPF